MRRLLFLTIIALLTFSITTCSDSGTGPDNNNDINGGGDETTTYTVSVDATPSDAGSISPSAEDTYDDGEEIELQANPSDGYVFTEWTGDIGSTDNPHSLTVDQDYNITANFELKSYELTVNTEGEGTVSKEVLEQKSKDYEHGTVVELTANPAEGYKFVEWQGDITGSENPDQITVDEAKGVIAVFEVATYPLTIDVSGEGSVTVTPDQEEYAYGTEVELLAEPNSSDWEFESWDGDTTSTDNPLTISVNSSITITGKFANTLFAGGAGTKDNPYKIATIDQLQAINEYPEAHYVQKNDIEASETENWNNGKGLIPIGDQIIPFQGTYDGNNKVIKDLFINNENEANTGLFGWAEGVVLEDLKLSNLTIENGGVRTGGLVGNLKNEKIENCEIKGTIRNASLNTGGLAGQLSSSEIIRSNTDVIINSSAQAGLLVGNISMNSIVKDSYTAGNLTIENNYAGGITYNNYGEIINSYTKGSITGTNVLGGIAGINNGTITNSYSIIQLEGEESIGGLVGENRSSGNINSSFATGELYGNNEVGGIIGVNGGSVNSNYWDKVSTKQSSAVGRGNSDGTTELTTSEMTGSSAQDNMPDFDWIEIWVTTDSYPALFWE